MIKNNDNLTNAFIAFQKVFKAEKWQDWDWRVKNLAKKRFCGKIKQNSTGQIK